MIFRLCSFGKVVAENRALEYNTRFLQQFFQLREEGGRSPLPDALLMEVHHGENWSGMAVFGCLDIDQISRPIFKMN